MNFQNDQIIGLKFEIIHIAFSIDENFKVPIDYVALAKIHTKQNEFNECAIWMFSGNVFPQFLYFIPGYHLGITTCVHLNMQ